MGFDKRVLAIAGLVSGVALATTASAAASGTAASHQPARHAVTAHVDGDAALRDRPLATFSGGPAAAYGDHATSDEANAVAAWNAKVIRATDQLAADRGGSGSFAGTIPADIVREASAAGLDRSGYDAADQRAKAKAAPAHLPEPATWGMLILGFGGIGFGLRRAHRRSEEKFNEKIKRITNGLAD